MRSTAQVLLVVVLFLGATARIPALPKEKEDAREVVTGTVLKLTVDVDKHDDGRVITKYTALVRVKKVERTTPNNGKVVKPLETITVHWSHVTRPTGSPGHTYDVKEKAIIRAYLIPQCGVGGFHVIDNAGGIETLDRQRK